VPPLFRILAGFLAVLWLPLTAHCELETIGAVTPATVADDGCCLPADGCLEDACGLIEGANFTPTHSLLKAPLPELKPDPWLALILAQISVNEFAPVIPAGDDSDHPRDWTSTWHFARRAAPLSRAPAILA
jgi:hypothetical protein